MAGFDATAMMPQFRVTCNCIGKSNEFVLFTRVGRGTSRFTVNNVFWGLLKQGSKFDVGDIITNSKTKDTLFLVAKTNSYRAAKGEFYKTNCSITIKRISDKYDGYDVVGKQETTVNSDIKAVYEDITGRMKMYDIGLLNTTVKRLIIPATYDIQMLDRIYLLDDVLQVDNINTSAFPSFYYVQCSLDNRGTISGT